MIERISDIVIVTDIDGSLLRAEDGVTKENREAIERFVGEGGDFTISTGRVAMAAASLLSGLPMTLPSMHVNGSYFYDWHEKKIIDPTYIDPISHELAEKLVLRFPFIDCYFANDKPINMMTSGDIYVEFLPGAFGMRSFFKGSFADIPEGVFKFIIICPPEHMEEVKAYAASFNCDKVQFIQSSPFFLELLPGGISKGRALHKLCQYANKPIENIVAVGDFDNDIDMLREAGIGCAVGNATPEVKAVADMQLVRCEESAIAQLIRHFEELYA